MNGHEQQSTNMFIIYGKMNVFYLHSTILMIKCINLYYYR